MIQRITCYLGTGTEPYENLAVERFLMEAVEEGELILYLWQNRRTVVIGRNQNPWRECRLTELQRDGGSLARRLSGGGAVYHDLGNLNFTFCVQGMDYDLRRQQSVILEACHLLGIGAELSGRNDLLAEGRKFSGNSFYNHNGYAFHNGTLLVDADLECLGKYLSPSRMKLEGKGVDSVRSRVVNLAELHPGLTVEHMCRAMTKALESIYQLPSETFSAERWNQKTLEQLRTDFARWEWIYGKRLAFTASFTKRFSWGEVTLECLGRDGVLLESRAYTDAMDASLGTILSDALRGCRFVPEELCGCIRRLPLEHTVVEELCAWVTEEEI